jgi:hypothetical protein
MCLCLHSWNLNLPNICLGKIVLRESVLKVFVQAIRYGALTAPAEPSLAIVDAPANGAIAVAQTANAVLGRNFVVTESVSRETAQTLTSPQT